MSGRQRSAIDRYNGIVRGVSDDIPERLERPTKYDFFEHAERNAVYNGVSPETQERMNDRQDSLCLDLRSQLVDVQLEIKEVKRANLLQVILSGKTSK